jgi:hypothetical protein
MFYKRSGTEVPMRMFILFAVAVVIVALGFGVQTAFLPGSPSAVGSTAKEITTANTMSPHEIHVNYQGMKELPVHVIKDPF